MKWITRKDIKVDRVACPWLIHRFIDRDAQFLFVAETELLDVAARENAIPFDAPRLSTVKLNHRGDRCTFEAIIEDYNLNEPGLRRTSRDRNMSLRRVSGFAPLRKVPVRWASQTRTG